MISEKELGSLCFMDEQHNISRSDGQLFYNGISIDAFRSIEKIDQAIRDGMSLDLSMIKGAVLFGNIDVVQRVVWGGGDKIIKIIVQTLETTLVYMACERGNIEIAQFLVSLGCPHDEYSFAVALRSGNLEFIKWVQSIGKYDWDFKYIMFLMDIEITLAEFVDKQKWENGTENAINILEWMKSDGCKGCSCSDYLWHKRSMCREINGEYVTIHNYYEHDEDGEIVVGADGKKVCKKWCENDYSGLELAHRLTMKGWLESQVCSKHG